MQYAALNDIHFPYEGPAYFKALEKMRHWPDLRHIYLNGDVAEIESVSTHPKTPRAQQNLLEEIVVVNQKLDTLQNRFPDVKVTYIAGNHEHRIYRYIRDMAPQLWGLFDCPKLLKFDERGWKYVDYGPTQWVKCGMTRDLYLRHEPLAGGAAHAKATAEKAYVSLLYGHTHVYQQYTHKKNGPTPFNVTATSCGWLGDITQGCFDYRGSRDNWQSGFTRIDCDEQTGEYEVRFIFLD